MTSPATSLFALVILAQAPTSVGHGTVVDDQGKPVAGAQVVFHVPVPWSGKSEPLEVRATTDAEGRFRLVMPSLRRVTSPPCLDLGVSPRPGDHRRSQLGELPRTLVLHKPAEDHQDRRA